eukprot:15457002-Alexandrium_andersonii.AAC.1
MPEAVLLTLSGCPNIARESGPPSQVRTSAAHRAPFFARPRQPSQAPSSPHLRLHQKDRIRGTPAHAALFSAL